MAVAFLSAQRSKDPNSQVSPRLLYTYIDSLYWFQAFPILRACFSRKMGGEGLEPGLWVCVSKQCLPAGGGMYSEYRAQDCWHWI